MVNPWVQARSGKHTGQSKYDTNGEYCLHELEGWALPKLTEVCRRALYEVVNGITKLAAPSVSYPSGDAGSTSRSGTYTRWE